MRPSLYVHIPLCLKKCSYCDFFSVPIDRFARGMVSVCGEEFERGTDTVDASNLIVSNLIREIEDSVDRHDVTGWHTVYIGGGTPSLLTPGDVARLGEAILSIPSRRPATVTGNGLPVEWTIEANPEDITKEWLEACSDAGIGRLSVGIQSLDARALALAGRRGNRETNLRAADLIGRHWEGSVSYDLISGLPGQDANVLREDLRAVVSWKPDHVSLYSLSLEEGTPLERMVSLDPSLIPGGDEQADIWVSGRDYLEECGYRQYEVSNFALSGRESLHNLVYWNMGTWLGLGPGASGTVSHGETSTRFTNRKDIDAWIGNPSGIRESEEVGRIETIEEVILMGFRLARGLERGGFKSRFGVDILDCIGATAAHWRDRGLLNLDDSRIALTRDGLLFLNRFLSECLGELTPER